MVEFAGVVDALHCSTEIEAAVAITGASLEPDRRIEFRIGINVGDVVVEGADIFGDGINVASRLEDSAEPGGICVSARVQEDSAGRLDLAFDDMGEQALKNMMRPMRVYRVRRKGPLPSPPPQTGKGRIGASGAPALAVPDRATLLRAFAGISRVGPELPLLAACCAQIGRLDEAREIVQRLRALTPLVVPNATQWRKPEQRELYLAGLRLATAEVT